VRDFRLPPRINGICALLGYYTAYSGNSFLDFFTLENGTDRLFWNVGKDYYYMLRNNPEECRSLPLFGSPNEDSALVAGNCLPIDTLHVDVPTFGETCHLCLQGWSRHTELYPEDGKRKLLCNTGIYLLKYPAKNLPQTREKAILLSFHTKDSSHYSPMCAFL
jgi:hypothetical protein